MGQRKILIADEDPGLLKLLKARLEGNNYNVLTATTGREAINKAHRDKPDLIIVDIMLPDMSGYQVCENLKDDWQYKDIPVILSNAKDSWKDKSYAKAIGADDYLLKPFDYKDLLKRVEMCFSRAPMESIPVSQLGRKKILIAGSNKNLTKQLASLLEAHSFVSPDKYLTIEAETGPEVIEMARRDKPDLIAVDARLAKMDGYKVCRRLKEDPIFKKVTILILSDEKEEEVELEASLAGADGYLLKPFTEARFIKKIKWYLWGKK